MSKVADNNDSENKKYKALHMKFTFETIYPQIQKFQQKGGALISRMVLNQGECLFS